MFKNQLLFKRKYVVDFVFLNKKINSTTCV